MILTKGGLNKIWIFLPRQLKHTLTADTVHDGLIGWGEDLLFKTHIAFWILNTYSMIHSKCILTINEMVIQLLMGIFFHHAAWRLTQLGQLYMNITWIKMSSPHTLMIKNKPNKCTLLSIKNILGQLLIVRHGFSNSIALKTTLHKVSTYSVI